MKPTQNLRFVERDVFVGLHEVKSMRILQQWWSTDPDDYDGFVIGVNGEWRDVRLESE